MGNEGGEGDCGGCGSVVELNFKGGFGCVGLLTGSGYTGLEGKRVPSIGGKKKLNLKKWRALGFLF